MNKEEYKILEETKRLVDSKMFDIKRKECGITVLRREIDQLYEFINDIQRIGELETMRIDKLKDSDIKHSEEHETVLELIKENQSLKDRIEKAIEYIENNYYKLNATIVLTTSPLLNVRKILKGNK